MVLTDKGPGINKGGWFFGAGTDLSEQKVLQKHLPAIELNILHQRKGSALTALALCSAVRLNETHIQTAMYCFSDIYDIDDAHVKLHSANGKSEYCFTRKPSAETLSQWRHMPEGPEKSARDSVRLAFIQEEQCLLLPSLPILSNSKLRKKLRVFACGVVGEQNTTILQDQGLSAAEVYKSMGKPGQFSCSAGLVQSWQGYILKHDANTLPGFSGGYIVTLVDGVLHTIGMHIEGRFKEDTNIALTMLETQSATPIEREL